MKYFALYVFPASPKCPKRCSQLQRNMMMQMMAFRLCLKSVLHHYPYNAFWLPSIIQ